MLREEKEGLRLSGSKLRLSKGIVIVVIVTLLWGIMATPTASVWQRLAELTLRRIPEPVSGIWGALREHLNPALYRPIRSDQVEAVPLMTQHGQPYPFWRTADALYTTPMQMLYVGVSLGGRMALTPALCVRTL